jgi:hypothetical protein
MLRVIVANILHLHSMYFHPLQRLPARLDVLSPSSSASPNATCAGRSLRGQNHLLVPNIPTRVATTTILHSHQKIILLATYNSLIIVTNNIQTSKAVACRAFREVSP